MSDYQRLPRPWEYATYARYFSAVMGWLDWALPGEDNRIERARVWRAIEQKESWNLMPIKKPVKAKVESPLEREARVEMAEMARRAGRGPEDDAAVRARVIELVKLPRDLTPEEQSELDAIAAERHRRRAAAKKLTKAINKRQKKHPEESRADSALHVVKKWATRDDARRDAEDEQEDAAEEAAAAERQAARAAAQTAIGGRTPAPSPQTTAPAIEPPKRRRRSGFSVSYIPLD